MTVLSGKTALVTGASRGIGAAIARRLHRDGARVILHYGSSLDAVEALARELGGSLLVQADLGAADGPRTLADAAIAALDGAKLDILVNNAGVADYLSFEETDAQSIDRQYAINVRAPFLLSQGLGATLADDASVVFTSSIVANTHFDGILAYSVTKGAVDTLVRHLAAHWGPRGIRVNAVAPGAILTDMSRWLEEPANEANTKSIQALSRIGRPDDIAGVVAFLAGPDSGWVTGQVIDASGGTKL